MFKVSIQRFNSLLQPNNKGLLKFMLNALPINILLAPISPNIASELAPTLCIILR